MSDKNPVLPSSNATGGCANAASIIITLVDPWLNPITPREDLFAFSGPGPEQAFGYNKKKQKHVNCLVPGMGTLSYKGEKSSLAEACGFLINEDGIDANRRPDWKSPAKLYAEDSLGRSYVGPVTFHQLCQGIPLAVRKGSPLEYVVEVQVAAEDWCILMAFLDNHSGGIHGSGHAGAMIVNGKNGRGLFADFGPYYEAKKDGETKVRAEVGEVRILEGSGFRVEQGKLVDATFCEFFDIINEEYGSGINSKKKCSIDIFLEGPAHESYTNDSDPMNVYVWSPTNFAVNGLIAWAAFKLKKGAYAAMERFCRDSQAYAEEEQNKAVTYYTSGRPKSEKHKKMYGNSFNCMTFSLAVLEQGKHPQTTMRTDFGGRPEDARNFNVDHPNDHIGPLMKKANDAGFFDHRKYMGEHEASTKQKQTPQRASIRHHQSLGCVSYP